MASSSFLQSLIEQEILLVKNSLKNSVFNNLLNKILSEEDLGSATPVSDSPTEGLDGISKPSDTSVLPQENVKALVQLTKMAVDALNTNLSEVYNKNPAARKEAKNLLELNHISAPKCLQSLKILHHLISTTTLTINLDDVKNADYESLNYLVNLIKKLLFVRSKDFDSENISLDLSNLKQSENLDPVSAEKSSKAIIDKLKEYIDNSTTPPDVT
jgi:hypothetical protein